MNTVRKTNDSSMTVYSSQFDECYHSIHGARQEALHVFIEAGLNHVSTLSPLTILEFGFGTGLNCLLTLLHAKQDVFYHSIDAYPLDNHVHDVFASSLDRSEQSIYRSIHMSSWNKETRITPRFTLLKQRCFFQDVECNRPVNLIYFDAFSPRKQPECWSLDIFSLLYTLLDSDGIMVTYCAKGDVKRGLKRAGFCVETLAGPPGKREMIRATKQ
ncbi:tRNA (5-methylaminomethyl-2-thiouridine)(34)-methyltransferase MnmD [bacterium]|nr:tRNA (5-methylaminomethyl-2-thiouridine)(34)-methyltransferase MnmD [bacterium]